MEILGLGEILANLGRPDLLPIHFQQASICLPMKENLAEGSDDSRVNQPREHCQDEHQAKRWGDMVTHKNSSKVKG
jgi:hypothetical protein